jgi:hypothetical protein
VAELHERAWSIVGPRFEANQAAAADRFRAQAGTGLASAGIAEVVAASAAGRVDVLFVEVGSHAWGCLDRENLDVRLDDGPTPENEDLLDVAAVRTLRLGGTVYAVERDDMPTDGAVAAVFRY